MATIISGKDEEKLLIINDLLPDVKEQVIMQQDLDKKILKRKLDPFNNAWTTINNGTTAAKCNFIEYPKSTVPGTPDPNTHLITRSGQVFYSLLSQNSKQFEKLMKSTTNLTDMSDMTWYNWYTGFVTSLAIHGVYSKPYEEWSQESVGTFSFICDNHETNPEADLPIKFINNISTWSKQISMHCSRRSSARRSENNIEK